MSIQASTSVNTASYSATLYGADKVLVAKYLRDGMGLIPHRLVWEMFQGSIRPIEDAEAAVVFYAAYVAGQGVTLS